MTNTNPTATPFNFTTPNWALLEAAIAAVSLPPEVIGEFMWMGEWREGEHQYKHCITRNYVILHGGVNNNQQVIDARAGYTPRRKA